MQARGEGAFPGNGDRTVIRDVQIYQGPSYSRLDYPAEAASLIDFHVQRFVDRERELSILAEFAARPEPGYLIVWAGGGLGKSSLLAELIDRHRSGGWNGAAPRLVYFFVRADGARDTSAAFLQAANAQLLELLSVPGGTPSELSELRAQFSELWSAAAGAARVEAPLLLLVDAADEMAEEPADIADVLPMSLGDYVHVVVSSRPNPDPRELVIREHPLRAMYARSPPEPAPAGHRWVPTAQSHRPVRVPPRPNHRAGSATSSRPDTSE